jgi:hypothetical protein
MLVICILGAQSRRIWPKYFRRGSLHLRREDSGEFTLDLLWDALGEDDGVYSSSKIFRVVSNGRVNDTTVVR